MGNKGFDVSQGICLHHRDGLDWHEHCARWSAIKDGIYRGNCLNNPKETLIKSLESRALILPRWLYYVGDHDIPQELVNSKYNVVSKNDFVDTNAMAKYLNRLPEGPYRDLWSLIDSLICSSLPWFVGNSVSTWSAIQIANRQETIKDHETGSYWYNSQSIPLADVIPMYQIPIVYTYTEMSAGAGKFLLKASISSVRKHLPYNMIHILYHGKKDKDFRVWLKDNAVMIHQHNPEWRKDIETMRTSRAGNTTRSHLFLHEGNYFGTWQRIDIPKFITSEYCLLLDSDTIVVKPFTFDEFGLKLTRSVAFSAEGNPKDKFPWNAGISLMNVPYLKETYQEFFRFIMKHVNGRGYIVPLKGIAVSDQGAYLEFYKKSIQFLSIDFNFKPYYNVNHAKAASAKIVHFHGPKPHNYIGHFSGLKCDAATQKLCNKAGENKHLCSNVQAFAKSLLLSGEGNIMGYCRVTYATNKDYQGICFSTLNALATSIDVCTDLSFEVNNFKTRYMIGET